MKFNITVNESTVKQNTNYEKLGECDELDESIREYKGCGIFDNTGDRKHKDHDEKFYAPIRGTFNTYVYGNTIKDMKDKITAALINKPNDPFQYHGRKN